MYGVEGVSEGFADDMGTAGSRQDQVAMGLFYAEDEWNMMVAFLFAGALEVAADRAARNYLFSAQVIAVMSAKYVGTARAAFPDERRVGH